MELYCNIPVASYYRQECNDQMRYNIVSFDQYIPDEGSLLPKCGSTTPSFVDFYISQFGAQPVVSYVRKLLNYDQVI